MAELKTKTEYLKKKMMNASTPVGTRDLSGFSKQPNKPETGTSTFYFKKKIKENK